MYQPSRDNNSFQNINIQQSMRVYQDLMEENLHLKQKIQRSRTKRYLPFYRQLPLQPNEYNQLTNNPLHDFQPASYGSPLTLDPTDFSYYDRNIDWDIKLSNQHYLQKMLQRNRFLEQKIDRLKSIYDKQYHDISEIRRSRKWEDRYDCKEDNCYEDKYMQLLRVRSPFF